MLPYALRRLILALPLLVGITLISFVLMHMAPGEPTDLTHPDATTTAGPDDGGPGSPGAAHPGLRAHQAHSRAVLELADAERPAGFRALVLAGRAPGPAEDPRAAAGHATPQHRRDDDHRGTRDPDRGDLGDAPVLEVRQGHDHVRVRGLRHAGFLAGPHAHDPVRGPARMASHLGSSVADVGVPLLLAAAMGFPAPSLPADRGRHLRRPRQLLSLHAAVDARGGAAGLHPVRAGRGARRGGGSRA